MNVPEITEVKDLLDELKGHGLIREWELPYENLLTRRTAAIFFIEPNSIDSISKIWEKLEQYDNFFYRENIEKELSQLDYRITFNPDDRPKG